MDTSLQAISTAPIHMLAQTGPDASQPPGKVSQIVEYLQQMPGMGWAIAGFGVVAMVVAAVAALTGNLDKIFEFFRKYYPRAKAGLPKERLLKLRSDLLEIEKGIVAKRLKDSLHNLVRIDLDREEQLQQVGRPTLALVEEDQNLKRTLTNLIGRRLQVFSQSNDVSLVEPSNRTNKILNRDDIKGRLLLLGEPGAGKTTELLLLAEQLIREAEKSTEKPIPVVLELSTWQQDIPLTKWIGSQLYKRYRIAQNVTEQWIQQNQLIPLLDGLDELGLKNQGLCIDAIDKWLSSRPATSAVVCCRREEYEHTQQTKQLRGAIYLQPATTNQIRSYLKDLNRESLWSNIQVQPALLELAKTPLFLMMLVVAYEERPIRNQRELFEAYIEKQIPGNNGSKSSSEATESYTRQTTVRYLAWLAKQLEDRNETEFLIEEIQPSWLPSDMQRVLYQLSVGLLVGLSLGLYIGSEETWPLTLPAVIAVAAGVGARSSYIRSREKVKWSARRGLNLGWPFGLWTMLVAGLLGLIEDMFFREPAVLLASGLVGGLAGGLMAGMYSVPIMTKRYPNQGVRSAVKSSFAFCALCGVIGSSVGGLADGLAGGITGGWTGVYFGVFTLLLSGEFFGGGLEVVLQHLVLRAFLLKNGNVPRNYKLFLGHAVQHRLVQQTGGRYRFIHDLLRKHFAQLSPDSL